MMSEEDQKRYIDDGIMPLENANEMNVPVNCFLCKGKRYWIWSADNFMPRKSYATPGAYLIKSTRKKDIIQAVRKYVVPLYRVALDNITEDCENYYWERNEDDNTDSK